MKTNKTSFIIFMIVLLVILGFVAFFLIHSSQNNSSSTGISANQPPANPIQGTIPIMPITPGQAENDDWGKCYVGGCSGQICSNDPNAISNCIYHSDSICYKFATCERQASGECGWTQTPALTACIKAADSSSTGPKPE